MKIEQKRIFCGRQSIEILDEEKLRYSEHRLNRHVSYEIELIALDPKTVFMNEKSPGKLAMAFVTVGVGVWIAVASVNPATWDWYIGGFFAGILVILLGIGGWLLWQYQNEKAHGHFVYFRHGGGAFGLWHNQPNPAVYSRFLEALREAVEKAEKDADSKAKADTDSMAHEVRELAKLRDEGIISEEEYTAGKRRILGMDDPDRHIGFH